MKIIIDPVEDKKADVVAVINAAFKSHNEKVDEAIEENAGKGKGGKKDKVTKAQCKKALQAFKEQNGMKGVKKILQKYGANLDEVDKSDYAALVADLALDDDEE